MFLESPEKLAALLTVKDDNAACAVIEGLAGHLIEKDIADVIHKIYIGSKD